MQEPLTLHVGVKTDLIEYRYSYEWLFRLLADEGIRYVQLGTFFELYQLPDNAFVQLRWQAEDFGLTIFSVFTAHRELGGFFRADPNWEQVARRNYERLIEIGRLVGARSVGSNPGAVLRDRMGLKTRGIRCYLENMKAMMHQAHRQGLDFLTIEPMSCLAEPPTTPQEIQNMAEELDAYHHQYPHETCRAGYCLDVSHGYADQDRVVRCDHMMLLKTALPYTTELHLKNTDRCFESTFGFSSTERQRGVVAVEAVRDLVLACADQLPVRQLVGYVEIAGPKTGRDYTDSLVEDQLRETLRFVKSAFCTQDATSPVPTAEAQTAGPQSPVELSTNAPAVKIAPSLMCADFCHMESAVRQLERCGVDLLHIDIMDAHFVPNMPLGLELLKHLRPRTGLPFDVHLMVENNDFFIGHLASLGVEQISIHLESAIHADRSLALIRQSGMKAGAALNPATPLSALEYVVESLDFVVLMTVNPGFAGQKLVPSAFRKIQDCREYLCRRNVAIPIEVDGNVSFANIPRMVECGADILVAGTSSLFCTAGSLHENRQKMAVAIEAGLKVRPVSVEPGEAVRQ